MKVLFPTDFSPNSETALQYAIDFLEKVDGHLTLVHVYKVPTLETIGVGGMGNFSTGPGGRLQQKAEEDKQKSVQNQLAKLRLDYGLSAGQAEIMAVTGNVKSEIDRILEEQKFDLVVLGTRGENSQRGIFFGGIASHLINSANCPVLAVPPGTKYKDVKQIVYPTDLLHQEKNSLDWLVNYARLHKAKVHLLHISDQYDESNKKEFHDIVDELSYDFITFETVHGDDVPHVIVGISKDEEVSMISMTTHTTTLFDRIFHSSLTADVLERINIPFIGFSENNLSLYKFK